MRDNVSYKVQPMDNRKAKPPKARSRAKPLIDSKIRELLDHVAEELAREYVRLMKDSVIRREK